MTLNLRDISNHQSLSYLTGGVITPQKPSKEQEERQDQSFLLKQGTKLYYQGRYKAARGVFLQLKEPNAWVQERLVFLSRQLNKKSPAEKMRHNFVLTQLQQQTEEKSKKPFTLYKEAIESTVACKDKTFYIQNESTFVYGRQIGIASCQGHRQTMEDATLAVELPFLIAGKEYQGELYAVFDGHGGSQAAQFAKQQLAIYLIKHLQIQNPQTLTKEGIYQALNDACLELDEACENMRNGTTATLVLLVDKAIYSANIGDSRAILDNEGLPIQLSCDGNLFVRRFSKKVIKLGGEITIDAKGTPRIMGILNVSGSIGDRYIKGSTGKCCVPPQPQTTVYPRPSKGFLFLACDGYFFRASTHGTVYALHELAKAGELAPAMAKTFVFSALKNGGKDNISVVIVPL